MKLQLANGAILECETVLGNPSLIHGTHRDSLTFVFDPDAMSLNNIMEIFTEENCKTIIITNEETNETFVHENYTIRTGLGISAYDQVMQGGIAGTAISTSIKDVTPKAWVTMVQTTYAERTIQEQQQMIDSLIVAQLMQ